MDQNLLQAFGVDKLRFQDVFVFVAFAAVVILFKAPDSFVLQPSWRLDIMPATGHEKAFLPLPVIADLDGDGINEIVIATREPGLKVVMLPNLGVHKKPAALPHLHTKAEVLLPSDDQASFGENKSSPSFPVAMATGCLHKSGSDLTTCQQVIVVMMDDTKIFCYSHQLKLLWKAQLHDDKVLPIHFYKEVSIHINHGSVKGGLVVVGLRLGEEISFARSHRHDQMLNHSSKPSQEKIIDSFPKDFKDIKGESSRFEDHFSTYALSGLSGRLRWKHEPGDFEKNQTSEDDLSSYHYKLALRSSQYHVGEVHWRHYSRALSDVLPHRISHPSHAQIKLMNFVKDSHMRQGVKQPNAAVIHNERGIEVVDAATGRPLCHFPSPKSTVTLADINQDGVVDEVESMFWAHPAQKSDKRIPHCSGVARSGGKILFVGPVCHSPSVFEYMGQARDFDPEEYGDEPLKLPPLVVESPPHRSGIFSHLMGRSVRRDNDGYDAIFLLSSGKVTSYGSFGEFNWQVDTDASWGSYIAGDKYHRGEISSSVEERFVPDLQAVKHIVTQQRPESVLVVGWRYLATISLGKGEITSSHSLPCQSISPVVQGDFTNDDITDFIVHCRTSYLGFVLHREPGYWWTAVWIASGLVIVLTAVFCLRAIEEEITASSSP